MRPSPAPGRTAPAVHDAWWDGLAVATGAPPFTRPGWVRAWCEMTGRTPVTAAVDGAVLPLVRRGGGVATAADWHVPLAGAAAVDAGALTRLAGSVVPAHHRVTLDFCDAAGPTAAAFRAAMAGHGFTVHERLRMRSPFVDLGVGREAYRAGLDGKKLRELGRRRRRLGEEGAVAVSVEDGSVDLDAALTAGFAVEGAGWKGARGTAIRSHAATERFYRRVAAWAAAEGMLRLRFLRVDGAAIAFDLALVAAGREWLLKTGYSPDWSRFAPGALLREAAIDDAFARGLSRYEFAGRADPWKLEWTGTTRDVVRIDGFAPDGRGRVLAAAAGAARIGHALTPSRLIHRVRG